MAELSPELRERLDELEKELEVCDGQERPDEAAKQIVFGV